MCSLVDMTLLYANRILLYERSAPDYSIRRSPKAWAEPLNRYGIGIVRRS
jgi:hypothetical protein